jgi:hypothetical protein
MINLDNIKNKINNTKKGYDPSLHIIYYDTDDIL